MESKFDWGGLLIFLSWLYVIMFFASTIVIYKFMRASKLQTKLKQINKAMLYIGLTIYVVVASVYITALALT